MYDSLILKSNDTAPTLWVYLINESVIRKKMQQWTYSGFKTLQQEGYIETIGKGIGYRMLP